MSKKKKNKRDDLPRANFSTLKTKRNELIKELGVSKSKFKSLIPKIVYETKLVKDEKTGKNKKVKTGNWEVASRKDLAEGKGARMKIRKQVVWLAELVEATRELREAALKEAEEMNNELTKEPTFNKGESA